MFGVCWVLCVFYPFVNVVCALVGYDPVAGGQATLLPVVLAMFHTCFNVTNTMLLIGFIPQLERVVCKLLPERQQAEAEQFHLRYIQANLVQTPEISVLQAQKETALYAQRVQQMFALVRQLVDKDDDDEFAKLFTQIGQQEDITDKMEIEIGRFLEDVSKDHLSDITKLKVRQIMREIGELESIGDACYNMARTLNRRNEYDTAPTLTPALRQQLHTMMQLIDDALTQMNSIMSGHGRDRDINETYRIENDINEMRHRLKAESMADVNNQKYSYVVGIMFSDLVGECEKLGDYVVNVVQARLGQ